MQGDRAVAADALRGWRVAVWADRPVLTGFDAEGVPVLRPAASTPTLRQLLTHTSGFGYELFNADLVRWHDVTGTPGLAANGPEMLEAPLVADPSIWRTNMAWQKWTAARSTKSPMRRAIDGEHPDGEQPGPDEPVHRQPTNQPREPPASSPSWPRTPAPSRSGDIRG